MTLEKDNRAEREILIVSNASETRIVSVNRLSWSCLPLPYRLRMPIATHRFLYYLLARRSSSAQAFARLGDMSLIYRTELPNVHLSNRD